MKAGTRFFRVHDFEKYQHYKKRTPPWVKLYGSLLDDYSFAGLPDHSKWFAVALLILASRTDNQIPNDPAWVRSLTLRRSYRR